VEYHEISAGPFGENHPCPSVHELKANMSSASIFNDSSALPNGYNAADILNMPSFMSTGDVWPPKGNSYTETVSGILARKYKKSVLGLYFADQNPTNVKEYERSPSVQRLTLAVEFYGTWFMDKLVKGFCDDLLTKKNTLLVHLRSCDYEHLPLSYVHNIGNVSKEFQTVVLTGGCHADERYASHRQALSNLVSGVELVYSHMREHGVECKLRFLPNYNPDDALYAFRVASNVLVERSGFAALGVLLTQGNAYLDQPMKTYYDNTDFKNLISNPKFLWKHDGENKSASVLDKVAQVTPTDCLFETFGAGNESKRMCMTASVHDEKCWVMSIGSNGQFGFERDIFFRTNCSVHIFDCTEDWQIPKTIATRIFLHKFCIGQKELSDGVRNFLPYDELVAIATNKVNDAPMYLKIDFQGNEFQVLPAILAHPRTIHPIQIGFELHLTTSFNAGPSHEHLHKDNLWVIEDELDVGLLFYKLKSFGAYKVIAREDDPLCQTCAECVVMK